MQKPKDNWRIYPSKSHGVMIEYHDLSGKLLLALNCKPAEARQLAEQILSAVQERENGPRRMTA